jgi:serine/threonine protein kinase/Tol biopolymer transport system component
MSGLAWKGRRDAGRLRQIEEVYHEARERAESERGLFLVTTCRDDQELLDEVTSLLDLDNASGPFERPVLDLAAGFLDEPMETAFVPGAKVGPYEILGRIGAGGMGEVFKAHDTRLGRTVAIKMVYARIDGSSHLEEARAIAALNHPNICTLHDVGPNYLVLELVEGETLAERLRRGALPTAEVLAYGAQIADALHCAHSKGITHGDLKPNNLMLTKAGIKILDFGLAQFDVVEAPAQPPQPALGTPAYLSPEQLADKPREPRTDIFALGLVLFEMATGARPFSGNSRAELTDAILHQEPPLGRLSPPAFAHIVERCLAKAPEDRWQTARDVKLELDYVARSRRQPAPVRAGKRMWWLLAAASLLVVIAAGIYFRRSRPEVLIEPFTSYPGSEESPAFSPDGDKIAFSWDGPQENNRDIYVKQIGPGNPVRLTTDPADEVLPRWSPDGKWIAFLRREKLWEHSLYVIPALGGLERRIAGSTQPGFLRHCLDWSPDGQWLVVSLLPAWSGGAGLALVSPETGEVRQITRSAASPTDSAARFSPDGSALAFQREGEGLMIQPLTPDWKTVGPPRKLVVDVSGPIRSISWTPDGRELILVAGMGQTPGLWRVSASGNSVAQRLSFGESAADADVARRAERLAFSRSDSEMHVWSLELDKSGRASGQAVKSFESTRSELTPSFSKDGTRVAFGSSRSGNDEIWTCLSDASNCAQLTSMKGSHAGSPAWSPDGNWIAFDVSYPDKWEVQIVPASGGKARRLAAGMIPSWSHDGKWVYFQSRIGGATWRVPAQGGKPEELGDGLFPQESPDGEWLYYVSKERGQVGGNLKRMSMADGRRREEELPIVTAREYLVRTDGIWFISREGRQEAVLSFYDFATKSVRAVYQPSRPVHAGLAVSPDGIRVLFTQIERNPNVDLVLAEHFR